MAQYINNRTPDCGQLVWDSKWEYSMQFLSQTQTWYAIDFFFLNAQFNIV